MLSTTRLIALAAALVLPACSSQPPAAAPASPSASPAPTTSRTVVNPGASDAFYTLIGEYASPEAEQHARATDYATLFCLTMRRVEGTAQAWADQRDELRGLAYDMWGADLGEGGAMAYRQIRMAEPLCGVTPNMANID